MIIWYKLRACFSWNSFVLSYSYGHVQIGWDDINIFKSWENESKVRSINLLKWKVQGAKEDKKR